MVGAVLTKGNRIIGSGYNGAPMGVRHCTDVGNCLTFGGIRCRRTIHAEVNAILSAGVSGIGIGTGEVVLYCTLVPCAECLKLCVGAKVDRVVYFSDRETPDTWELLKDYGEVIKLERFKVNASRRISK
jgi:dCMP deaminase